MRVVELIETAQGVKAVIKMQGNKYTYYKVIQGNYGYGWDDEDFHECDSSFRPLNRQALRVNLEAYQVYGMGGQYRVVKRRELNSQQKAA